MDNMSDDAIKESEEYTVNDLPLLKFNVAVLEATTALTDRSTDPHFSEAFNALPDNEIVALMKRFEEEGYIIALGPTPEEDDGYLVAHLWRRTPVGERELESMQRAIARLEP